MLDDQDAADVDQQELRDFLALQQEEAAVAAKPSNGSLTTVWDEDEGLYRLVLEHSRFDNDSPFLTAAQHAGFAPPPDNSLEPPLHRRMLALSTALPHSDGVGRWDDLVPALPS
ncbi:hypothetical protein LENED_004660 [Lentinula edodes]|uniref:Uncharacterized protein n=1 Tax=Lentinula edodes TaxID=5353 RepID=A0A1Q3E728_LENED|nr:hypothetical protein LENED_004660 [Lentinula edodes]